MNASRESLVPLSDEQLSCASTNENANHSGRHRWRTSPDDIFALTRPTNLVGILGTARRYLSALDLWYGKIYVHAGLSTSTADFSPHSPSVTRSCVFASSILAGEIRLNSGFLSPCALFGAPPDISARDGSEADPRNKKRHLPRPVKAMPSAEPPQVVWLLLTAILYPSPVRQVCRNQTTL